ncbi:O-antigen polymerase [Photobacterium carnosum]|uniref:O-antigen polymerase n=1 Tax=Photobacterium carnosum TaxID=2023717 RepID=UPI001E4E5DE3|nr:O-antigen polymerase [Photobacterium carnosum]MCD9513348.1 hypothetical protein [Photobacterium carnosum]
MRFLLYLLPLIYFLFSLYTTGSSFGYFTSLKPETIIYSSIDLLLSYALFFCFIYKNKGKLNLIKNELKVNFINLMEGKFFLISFLFFISIFFSYKSLYLSLSGVTREELNFSGNVSFYMMFFTAFIKAASPFVFYFKTSLKLKFIFCLSFISVMFYSASMAEMLYFLMMLVTLYTLFGGIKLKEVLIYLLAIFLLAFSVAIIGQESRYGNISFLDFILSIFIKVSRYRSFSAYLSEYIYQDYSFLNTFYPFFGYFSNYFNNIFCSSCGSYGSDFVISFHYLGIDTKYNTMYLANVIYPWWSFFVSSFGILGLFIKLIYNWIVLQLLLKYKFRLTFCFFICNLLYISQFNYFLMTLIGVINFLIFIFMDLILKKMNRRSIV